jgi:N-acetylmuramoyl-L-alanine amidase
MAIRKFAAAIALGIGCLASAGPSFATDSEMCLARNIYHEARGESRVDQIAVAHVVLNRTEHPRFPSTVCGVIHQRGQFSWTSRNHGPPRERAAWERALTISRQVLSGEVSDPTNGAVYFWNHRQVRPSWTRNLIPTLSTARHTYGKR